MQNDAVAYFLSKNENVVNKFKNQASDDWEIFLGRRAKELVSGVTFIIKWNFAELNKLRIEIVIRLQVGAVSVVNKCFCFQLLQLLPLSIIH